MLFAELRHVEAYQLTAQGISQSFGDLGLTYTTRTYEQVPTLGGILATETSASDVDGVGQLFNCLVLTEHT